MTKAIRVIGIGSPMAGDTVGIEAVGLLQQDALWQGRSDIEWLALERPGAALLHYFAGVDMVCLIDALDHPQAGVHRIVPAELMAQASGLSSHDFGVAEALLLAERLGQLPPRLLILGIALASGGGAQGWYPALSALLQQGISQNG